MANGTLCSICWSRRQGGIAKKPPTTRRCAPLRRVPKKYHTLPSTRLCVSRPYGDSSVLSEIAMLLCSKARRAIVALSHPTELETMAASSQQINTRVSADAWRRLGALADERGSTRYAVAAEILTAGLGAAEREPVAARDAELVQAIGRLMVRVDEVERLAHVAARAALSGAVAARAGLSEQARQRASDQARELAERARIRDL